jgi:hypothetical protein
VVYRLNEFKKIKSWLAGNRDPNEKKFRRKRLINKISKLASASWK